MSSSLYNPRKQNLSSCPIRYILEPLRHWAWSRGGHNPRTSPWIRMFMILQPAQYIHLNLIQTAKKKINTRVRWVWVKPIDSKKNNELSTLVVRVGEVAYWVALRE